MANAKPTRVGLFAAHHPVGFGLIAGAIVFAGGTVRGLTELSTMWLTLIIAGTGAVLAAALFMFLFRRGGKYSRRTLQYFGEQADSPQSTRVA
jgi:uncharacterized membrane protein YhiD involved in acid resistance